jgi:hypothetical protein
MKLETEQFIIARGLATCKRCGAVIRAFRAPYHKCRIKRAHDKNTWRRYCECLNCYHDPPLVRACIKAGCPCCTHEI